MDDFEEMRLQEKKAKAIEDMAEVVRMIMHHAKSNSLKATQNSIASLMISAWTTMTIHAGKYNEQTAFLFDAASTAFHKALSLNPKLKQEFNEIAARYRK